MRNFMKQNKAITLIALVITIIVLLILAGVTIATLTGDNGLLQKATNAKQATEEASALEKVKVEVAGSYGLDGKIDKEQLIKKDELPICMTSYSPCFRKEIGSHGLEERGLYRVHQFEKQEMIVLCEPEDSMNWYNKMWKLTVDLFRSWNVPVRQLECCSGDLADLKVKSCDV